MITKADVNMLPGLKKIWQVCFGDNARGADFVFDKLLGPTQMLVHTDNSGRPIAMLNWKNLRFTTPDQTLQGAYIFGVGTLPEYRSKGISTALMKKADEILREEGAKLSCLVPAQKSLFDFYALRGYSTQFVYKLVRVNRGEIPKPSGAAALRVCALEDLHAQRAKAFSSRAVFGDWDAAYLRYTGEECCFYGGEVLRFFCGGKPGYVVCYPRGNGVLVKEAVVRPQDLGTLFAALDARYRAESYEIRLPADFNLGNKWPGEILPFAMVKWYDNVSASALSLGGTPWFAFGLD